MKKKEIDWKRETYSLLATNVQSLKPKQASILVTNFLSTIIPDILEHCLFRFRTLYVKLENCPSLGIIAYMNTTFILCALHK